MVLLRSPFKRLSASTESPYLPAIPPSDSPRLTTWCFSVVVGALTKGGSGGALLLRAAGGLTVVGSRTLSSQGGAAGAPGSCTNIGGSGSAGRIRIDAPAATLTGLTATPAARRGPMWAASTPLTISGTSQTFTLIGAPSQQYFVVVNDMGAMMPYTTDVAGMVSVPLTGLPLGHFRICALVPGATFNANSEGQNCRTVLAFAP